MYQLNDNDIINTISVTLGAIARDRAAFGEGRGPIVLERVTCTGKEDSLYNCSSPGFGVHSCNHHQDAGVICQCE